MSAWYEKSFGSDYLIVYKHRDMSGAYEEVKQMIDWLELPQQSDILDLCCGMGRHAMALSDFGFNVTGLDLSEVLLEEAVKLDSEQKVQWIRGDMREVPLERTFDAIVNLFTSFAYFESDEENRKVLLEMNRLLKPKGKFIIDFLNANYIIDNLVPYSERTTDGVLIEETRTIENQGKPNQFVQKKIVIKEGDIPPRHYVEKVRLFGLHDLEEMMKDTDLVIDQVYGHYDQEDYDPKASPRLILIGHRGDKQL